MNRTTGAVLWSVTVATLASCVGGGTPSDGTVAVRDSAGIRIVENGPLSSAVAFRVGRPLYRIGGSDQDHNFVRVGAGVLLSDGRAAVGDGGSDELVILTPSGEVETVLGGAGQGPEEIGGLMSVWRLAGDTIVVEDIGNARISFFTPERFERSYRSGSIRFLLMGLGLEDRDLVMVTAGYSPYFEEPWLRMPLVRHPLDSQQWDTVRLYDFVPRISRDETPDPMRPGGLTGTTAGAILVHRSDKPEIERLDLEGATLQIIRWEEQGAPLTDSIWAIYEEYTRNRDTRRSDSEMREYLSEARAAASSRLPYSRKVRGDDAGNVWLAEYSVDFRHPTRYRVFDPEGRWLGWVHLPPRLQILDVAWGQILAIQRGDFDVESITVLPLER